MVRNIILDTDPGVDDAWALCLAIADPKIKLLGLTTVFGNGDVEVTSRNALFLLEEFNHPHIPVFKGSDYPFVVKEKNVGCFVHGPDSLGGINPKTNLKLQSQNAAITIVEKIKANPNEITIVAIGPLTNLACALSLDPEIENLVKEIVIMGGSIDAGGNINPAAEANIFNDPEAADKVFAANWPITLFPLDVTEKLIFDQKFLADMEKMNIKAINTLLNASKYYAEFYKKNRGFNSFVAHDVTAIAYCSNPELFSYKEGSICVITEGKARGMTLMDKRCGNWLNTNPWTIRNPVKIAIDINTEKLKTIYLEKIKNLTQD